MESTLFRIGDGVTVLRYSDREAFTVIDVARSGKRITIQRDEAILLNGIGSGKDDALVCHAGGFAGHVSGTQRYEYNQDKNGYTRKASLRKDGTWRICNDGARVVPGRNEFYDYNF